MAAIVLRRDEDLCQKYAFFASHLDRWHFDVLYWSLFGTNLMVLFLASWLYTKGQDTLEKHAEAPGRRAKSIRNFILLCLACVLLSTVCVVIEAYALLALQFCDGENLMSLYWATWTMIQVGSWIAMMGIILALAHAWRNRKHPPWALALGTPVLVIAGFLYLLHDCTSKRFRKTFAKQGAEDLSTEGCPSSNEKHSSQASNKKDAEIDCELVGFAIDGGPIVRFLDAVNALPPGLPHYGEVIGIETGNRPLVAYRMNSIRFVKAEK